MIEALHCLTLGTVLKNYTIIRLLGEGGFGITYLAKDNELGMEVVIKEYFPNEFAIRNIDSTIIAKTSSDKDFFKGMQRFKEEAQILAKFNHPSIVKILGYFEANNTAYFVMQYEEGLDLSRYMEQLNRRMTQEEILSIIIPILEGLKEVHKYNFLHRDIKPGNILLRSNKSPVLIDFGASKLALGGASKSITSMLTEGYAPLEQYSTDMKQQGAFTDIYAIAAVIYKMITGYVPPSAQTRSYQLLSDDVDPFKPLATMNVSGYDISFLKAVDRALSIKGKDRPQNVQDFQADIVGELKPKEISTYKTSKAAEKENIPKNNNILIGLLVLIIIFGSFLGVLLISKRLDSKSTILQVSQAKYEKEKNESKTLTDSFIEKSMVNQLSSMKSKKEVKWDKEKAENIIYQKMREYGDIESYGFSRKKGIRIKHEIVDFYNIPYNAKKEMIVIVSSVPNKEYECHACAPKLSFFKFTVENREWILSESYINAIQMGQWGSAPDKNDFKVVQLGERAFGLLLNFGYGGQGYWEDYAKIYYLGSGGISKIFDEKIGFDDSGAKEISEQSWKATIAFKKNQKYFYNIVINKKGKRDKQDFTETTVYIFDGKKYIKQQFENTNFSINTQEDTKSKEKTDKNFAIKQKLHKFLNDFYKAGESNNVNDALNFYSDFVEEYFGKKSFTKKDIYSDKTRYYKKWTKRYYNLIDYKILYEDIYDTSGTFVISSDISWKVESDKRTLNGNSSNLLKIKYDNGQFLVEMVDDTSPSIKKLNFISTKTSPNKKIEISLYEEKRNTDDDPHYCYMKYKSSDKTWWWKSPNNFYTDIDGEFAGNKFFIFYVSGFATGGSASYIVDLETGTYSYVAGNAKYLSGDLFMVNKKWYFDIGGYIYVDTVVNKDGNLIKFFNEVNSDLKCTPRENAQINYNKEKCITVSELLKGYEVNPLFLQSHDSKIKYIVD